MLNSILQVDIFLPRYKEPWSLYGPVVQSALDIKYPGNKLTVYVCDDGRSDPVKSQLQVCFHLHAACQQQTQLGLAFRKACPTLPWLGCGSSAGNTGCVATTAFCRFLATARCQSYLTCITARPVAVQQHFNNDIDTCESPRHNISIIHHPTMLCRRWTDQLAVGWCTCKGPLARVPKQATSIMPASTQLGRSSWF